MSKLDHEMRKVFEGEIRENELDEVIKTCQNNKSPGNDGMETIRLIDDIMLYTKERHIPGLMLLIDFEKAFDTVDRTYLINVLKLFGFGPSFIKWINIFFKENLSLVCNNGFSSEYFKLQRGVKQGDHLSAYVFVLGAEIMVIAIRTFSNIKAIQIGKDEIKITQFADDTTVFINDEKSLDVLLKVLESFRKISGLKINIEKTEVLWLGSMRNCEHNPLGFKCKKYVKSLGIFFSYDKKLRETLNFGGMSTHISQIINLWKQRNLTILGKITITKSLLLSKLVYRASMLQVPQEIISDIKKLIFKFLWNGPDKLRRKDTYKDYRVGGLRVTDIDSMLKASKLTWIGKLLSDDNKVWTAYLREKLERFGGLRLFLRSNYDIKQYDRLSLSPFYREILSLWQTLKDKYKIDQEEILWNNKDITIDGRPLYYETFDKIGIRYISDLIPAKETLSKKNISYIGLAKDSQIIFLIYLNLKF